MAAFLIGHDEQNPRPRSREHEQKISKLLNSLLRTLRIVPSPDENFDLGYTPSEPANWPSPIPDTVWEALDDLARAVTQARNLPPAMAGEDGQDGLVMVIQQSASSASPVLPSMPLAMMLFAGDDGDDAIQFPPGRDGINASTIFIPNFPGDDGDDAIVIPGTKGDKGDQGIPGTSATGSGGFILLMDGTDDADVPIIRSDVRQSANTWPFFQTFQSGIILPLTTSSSTGVIFKGASSFIHEFSAASTDGFNTFTGILSGNFTMAFNSATTDASYNSGFGNASLSSLTFGRHNTAVGYNSLNALQSGAFNCVFGSGTLSVAASNTSRISAFGYLSQNARTSGADSTSFGYASLQRDTTGQQNSAFGAFALTNLNITTGDGNNTAIGYSAGSSITTGTGNTIVGANVHGSATMTNTVIIADGTGNIRFQADSTGVDLKNNVVSGVLTPLVGTDAANKQFVEDKVNGVMPPLVFEDNSGDDVWIPLGNDAASKNFVTSLAMRNRIINGRFQIDQRNAGVATATADNAYWSDRWRYIGEATATCTAKDATVGGGRFNGAIKFTGTADKGGAWQVIEGVNCKDMRSQSVTLSVNLSVSNVRLGNIKIGIVEFTGTEDAVSGDPVTTWGADGTTPTLAANYAFLNTPANLNVTTTPTSYSVTATTGASGNNFAVMVWNDDKSYTANDTIYFTDVQLTLGGSTLAFDVVIFDLLMEHCQRYYQKYTQPRLVGMVPPTASAAARMAMQLPVPMRVAPTTVMGALPVYDSTTTTTITGISVDYTTANVAEYDVTLAGDLLDNRLCVVYQSGTTSLALSAEL